MLMVLYQGLEEAIATTLGSKPGDPLGSVMFNLLAARVLADIEHQAARSHLLKLPAKPEWQGYDVDELAGDGTHADDSAFQVETGLPEDTIDRMMELARITFDTYARYQLELNVKDDKTEALILMKGLRSKEDVAKSGS